MLEEIQTGGAVMKTISIFLALINLLFAGFLIALDLSYTDLHQGIQWWSLIKLSIALLIIIISLSSWLGVTGLIQPGLIFLGNMFLIALGPAAIVWAFHVAMTTGRMEYHMAVYGGSLMVQGVVSLLGFAEDNKNTTTFHAQ